MPTYESHPAAEMFPLMEGAEFDNFTADIAENGQRESIKLYEGKVLDGRNRYAACLKLGIRPYVEPYDGDEPYAYVISLNAKRRNLNESQLGLIAVAVKPKLEEEAKRRRLATQNNNAARKVAADMDHGPQLPKPRTHQGTARDAAGAMFGVSGKTVERAEKVLDKGAAELVSMVRAGKVSARAASVVADLPHDEQRQVVSRGPTYVRSKSSALERAARFQGRVKTTPRKPQGISITKGQLAGLHHAVSEIRSLTVGERFELWKHGTIRKCVAELAELIGAIGATKEK